MPRTGGVVIACNHFSWLDPAALGAACPRTMYYMAKIEAHRVPGLGHLIRAFGTFSVRRGESDREAVRTMRQIVREGKALGLFVEGTRQRSGVPGEIQPGAAMVALQEGVPIVPVALHGSQTWKPGNFHPVSVAWGTPMTFDGLPKGDVATARLRRCSRRRSAGCSTGSSSSTSSGARVGRFRRHDPQGDTEETASSRRISPARWRSSASPTWASRR